MWPETILAFTQMLEVPELRPDVKARALRSPGEISLTQGDPAAATDYLERWLELTAGMENMEDSTESVRQMLTSLK